MLATLVVLILASGRPDAHPALEVRLYTARADPQALDDIPLLVEVVNQSQDSLLVRPGAAWSQVVDSDATLPEPPALAPTTLPAIFDAPWRVDIYVYRTGPVVRHRIYHGPGPARFNRGAHDPRQTKYYAFLLDGRFFSSGDNWVRAVLYYQGTPAKVSEPLRIILRERPSTGRE